MDLPDLKVNKESLVLLDLLDSQDLVVLLDPLVSKVNREPLVM